MRLITIIHAIHIWFWIVATAFNSVKADDVTPIPAKAKVTFPGVAPIAAPVLPDAVSVLEPSSLFVVTSDEPFVLLASPSRLVTITTDTGPIKIRAVFADGSKKLETRTYSAKHIAIVEASAEGRVELLAIPNGFTDESDITRRLVDCVKAGQPPPDVDPVDPPIPAPAGVRVLMIFETSANNSREAMGAIYSPKVKEWLDKNCAKNGTQPEWRRFDPDIVLSANESPEIKSLWDAVKPKATSPPQVAIAVGGNVDVHPITTEADLLALLEKAVK